MNPLLGGSGKLVMELFSGAAGRRDGALGLMKLTKNSGSCGTLQELKPEHYVLNRDKGGASDLTGDFSTS